jgi:peptidoglycan/xylan/chitin deacetylase (PgdA/CDA1 family)/GT2 family glycosyltransferase
MKWSVVIPTWQRPELLQATLNSLGQQTFQNFEVIVVCDGEDIATRTLSENYAAPFELSWIFHDVNRGPGAARNTGASAASAGMLLFLDDDVIASPCLLRTHADEHAAAPDWPAYIVFGRTVEERQVPIVSKTDLLLQKGWEHYLEKYQPREGMPDTVSVGKKAESSVCCGLNCSIRRTLFEEIGGFDPVLRTGQDMELGLRLYRRGVQFRYAREAVVRHQDTKTMSTYLPRCSYLNGGLDVYRAQKLGQRSDQNSQLAMIRHGSLLWRMFARGAWRNPEAYHRAARVMELVTNLFGAQLCFRIWARLQNASEYWSGVRETGISEYELYRLAAPERRVLLFHSISIPRDSTEACYYTSPRRFRRYLAWMKKLGYTCADPNDWFCEKEHKRIVWLTFDDAYDDLYTEVLPVSLQLGFKALVFVVVDQIGGSNQWSQVQGGRARSLLTLGQMRELRKHGFFFGAHSMTHKQLPTLSNADLRREVSDSKSRLEDLLGEPVHWFAYPFGEVDRRVRAAVAEAGFKAAFTTQQGLNRWEDPLALDRIEINNHDTLLDFTVKLQTGQDVRDACARRMRRMIATWRKSEEAPA